MCSIVFDSLHILFLNFKLTLDNIFMQFKTPMSLGESMLGGFVCLVFCFFGLFVKPFLWLVTNSLVLHSLNAPAHGTVTHFYF